MLMRTRWATPKRQLPPGFIRPCQPVLSLKVPVGDGWNPRALAACLYMPSTSCTSAITTLRRLELVEPHQHSATYSAPAQAALPSRCCATNEPATQPKKPPKSAGVSDWKKYTPASHTADQTPPQSPKNKQTASACLIGHIWGFVAASAAVVALPCIFRAFLRRRLTALLADRTGSASSASGLTRPRHSLSISNARVATAPLANLLALGRTGVAFAPVLSEPYQSAEVLSFSEHPQRSYERL